MTRSERRGSASRLARGKKSDLEGTHEVHPPRSCQALLGEWSRSEARGQVRMRGAVTSSESHGGCSRQSRAMDRCRLSALAELIIEPAPVGMTSYTSCQRAASQAAICSSRTLPHSIQAGNHERLMCHTICVRPFECRNVLLAMTMDYDAATSFKSWTPHLNTRLSKVSEPGASG